MNWPAARSPPPIFARYLQEKRDLLVIKYLGGGPRLNGGELQGEAMQKDEEEEEQRRPSMCHLYRFI
jgi:hypothetical protein